MYRFSIVESYIRIWLCLKYLYLIFYNKVLLKFKFWYFEVCFDSFWFDLAGVVIRGDYYGNVDFFCSRDLIILGRVNGFKVYIMFIIRGVVVFLK